MESNIKTAITPLEKESYEINEKLAGFELFDAQSSNVEFMGLDRDGERLLVQFKGGNASYIYTGINKHTQVVLLSSSSVGGTISSIARSFPFVKHAERFIKPLTISTTLFK